MKSPQTFRRVAILSTGTEIVQGLYADTNARYLCEQCGALGCEVVFSGAAPDDEEIFESVLRYAAGQADLVICTGGLGPTEDDVNRDVFARVFAVELVRDDRAVAMMRQRFQARGFGEMPPTNETQAMVPNGAWVFYNEWGTAPGFFLPPQFERAQSTLSGNTPAAECALIALPGPPKEMLPMFNRYALPILQERAPAGCCVRTRTVHTFGRPESELNELTRDLFRKNLQVGFALLAKPYGVDFRISARGANPNEADRLLDEFEQQICTRVTERDVYGKDSQTLAQVVGELLIERNLTISAAESCTGGLLCKLLTDNPGSSAYLHRGYITYSNDSKQSLLGISVELLAQHGAVSGPVAREMADAARRLSAADIGVGITGISGPSGATPEKPVGLTYISIASRAGAQAHEFRFIGDREQNRLSAALHALHLVRTAILRGDAAPE